MDPRVSAMLRRQADEEMLLAQDRGRTAERALSTLKGWLQHGIDAGFCSDAVCSTHNSLPATEEEVELWEAGDDPCIAGVRIYREGERPCD